MKFILYLALISCSIVSANNFVVKEPSKKTSPAKLKQDVLTKMGDLLELQSKILETTARIQQCLCKNIRASLEGASSARATLTKLKEQLTTEYARLEQHKKAQEQMLSALRS